MDKQELEFLQKKESLIKKFKEEILLLEKEYISLDGKKIREWGFNVEQISSNLFLLIPHLHILAKEIKEIKLSFEDGDSCKIYQIKEDKK